MFLVHKIQPPVFETLACIPSLISPSWVLQRPHLAEKDGLGPWICFSTKFMASETNVGKPHSAWKKHSTGWS